MKHAILGGLAATLLTASTALIAVAPADAARCVSGAEVRGQVAAFVHGLRDDVAESKTRAHVRQALVEAVRTARGAKADTPHEQRGLGAEISVLARQLHTAEDGVARAAIRAQIHALQEQKRADHVTHGEERAMKRDLDRLAKKLAHATDSRGEGREVAAFVHALMAQFDC